MMKFTLAKHETLTTSIYPLSEPRETRTQITMVYAVSGDMENDHVHVQLVGHGKRRRRFRIDRLEIKWRDINVSGSSFYAVATGKTVLADGTISDRSHGYQHWSSYNWHTVPTEIAELVEGLS